MKIKFIPHKNPESTYLISPTPAIRSLPEWYKQKKPLVDGSKTYKPQADGSAPSTVKLCNPFGDALSAGYFLYLDADLFIEDVNGEKKITWGIGGDSLISMHNIRQFDSSGIPAGHEEAIFKFQNSWIVETPAGYSSLITQPFNRGDLPFTIFSGIVETDTFQLPINLPFTIRSDFEGIISAGTPIAQIIPFRRESWESEQGHYDAKRNSKNFDTLRKTLYRAYKQLHWQKKSWR